PSASADGKRLVATAVRGGHRQVVAIDLASRSLTDLTDDPTDHWNPAIAPDGRTVAYHKASPDATTPNVEPWGAPPGAPLRVLRLPRVLARRPGAGLPLGPRRLQEPLHHGRRRRERPAADRGEMDRHHVRLVADRRVDRLRQRPGGGLRGLARPSRRDRPAQA